MNSTLPEQDAIRIKERMPEGVLSERPGRPPSQPVEQEVMYCYRSDGAYIGEWREDGFHLDTSVVAPPEQQEQEGELTIKADGYHAVRFRQRPGKSWHYFDEATGNWLICNDELTGLVLSAYDEESTTRNIKGR